MKQWISTSAILFLAASSVYPGRALSGEPEDLVTQARAATRPAATRPATEVQLLDETSGPDEVAEAVAETDGEPVTEAEAAEPATDEAGSDELIPVSAGAKPKSIGKSEVNISDAGTVELHVNEANLVEVLRMLSLQSQKNIIASKEVRGTVTANLYDVTIREALDAILQSNGYGYREKGNFIYVYTEKELKEIEKAERQVTTETIRLYYTPAANAVTMIKPALSSDGQVSFTAAAVTGIASEATEAGGNSHAIEDVMVIRDYPENLERVRQIVKEIDRRPQQVLVEATIVAARLTENNALGVDFTVVGGVDFAEILHSDGQIRGVELPEGEGAFPNHRTHSVGTGNSFSRTVGDGFKFGYVSSNVSIFLSALEQVADTSVLANPKVLTLNKQKGEVLVGREDGYLTTTVTESTAVQTVEFLKTGTRLIFRPYIGNDGYIRMEVHPEDSDGRVVGGLPAKTTTEVTTNILVKDGHTIVIGGLFREANTSSKNQIPVLGNLPLVGPLFRNQTDATVREEIIILLTPHIVKDDQAYARASEEELRDMEKLRVGVRQGMMPWGRERMAESCYENAVAEMEKAEPNRKKAIWYLDCATNLNPKFLEAIKMKEELTGREVTAVDNSSVRHFVRRQIMAERAATLPAALITPGGAHTFPWPEDATGEAVAEAPTTRPAGDELSESDALLEESESEEMVAEAETGDEDAAEAEETVVEAESEEAVAEELSVEELEALARRLSSEEEAEEEPVIVTEVPLDEIVEPLDDEDGSAVDDD